MGHTAALTLAVPASLPTALQCHSVPWHVPLSKSVPLQQLPTSHRNDAATYLDADVVALVGRVYGDE